MDRLAPSEIDNLAKERRRFFLLGQAVGIAKRLEIERDYDEETGLLKKSAFKRRVERAVEQGTFFGILFIDINDLKLVNDIQGHVAGDDLIKRVAQVLEACTRSGQDESTRPEQDSIGHETLYSSALDNVNGRVGGDEFAVLVTNVDDLGLQIVQNRVQTAFSENGISAAIGTAIHQKGMSAAELYERADRAMYSQKLEMKNQDLAS